MLESRDKGGTADLHECTDNVRPVPMWPMKLVSRQLHLQLQVSLLQRDDSGVLCLHGHLQRTCGVIAYFTPSCTLSASFLISRKQGSETGGEAGNLSATAELSDDGRLGLEPKSSCRSIEYWP